MLLHQMHESTVSILNFLIPRSPEVVNVKGNFFGLGRPGPGACEPCGRGRYKPVNGSGACVECPAGAYESGLGRSACTACPAGTYSAATGVQA
jgi:hypothetical protein